MSTCESSPIAADEKFEYFDFLDDAQCYQFIEDGVIIDSRSIVVSACNLSALLYIL